MIGFFVGLLCGIVFGLAVSWYLCPNDDTERADYWIRHCEQYKTEVLEIKRRAQAGTESVQKAADDFVELLDREIWEN